MVKYAYLAYFHHFFLQRNRRRRKSHFYFQVRGVKKAQMGEIADNFEVAKRLKKQQFCHTVAGHSLEEPAVRINQTEYTQPLLLFHALASVL